MVSVERSHRYECTCEIKSPTSTDSKVMAKNCRSNVMVKVTRSLP